MCTTGAPHSMGRAVVMVTVMVAMMMMMMMPMMMVMMMNRPFSKETGTELFLTFWQAVLSPQGLFLE